ncbi:outer dynein arm-docking complex subunit 4 [Parambassis ranga]|uniref:Outer dynein arm-docking complex subunit 4 n=1 Tax=Parambassis ranga TaxID=210632 RepID=A0A6P7IVG5_9TELE|nr:tetratricopeptide repeat protein 25 [Parambassis ranga]
MDGDLDGQKCLFLNLKATGESLYTKGHYKNAIDSFTEALTVKPDDKNCLIGRSKCYLKMRQNENALKDAEASLKGDETFFKGLYQKAEALYYLGEFEFALVFYHRGQKLRPQIKEFRMGIHKTQEAIENSLCNPTVKLEIKGDLSFFKKDEETEHPITVIQNLMVEEKQLIQPPKREQTTKQLLREFYDDKKFLEDLVKKADLVKSRTKKGERLQDIIQGSIKFLNISADFKNKESPMFPLEKNQKQRKCSSKSCRSAPAELSQFLLQSLVEIEAGVTSGNAESTLKKVDEVMKMVQMSSEKEVPNKKEILGDLHSYIGEALFELGDIEKALEHHQKDLKLAQQCKLPEATSRALENIGRIYFQIGQFAQAIEFWEKKIPLVHGGLEKAWLFHEIGWCYLVLNCYKEARNFGVQSVAAADEIAHEEWQIDANVLVAQSELKLGNLKACVTHFERALNHARRHEDDAALDVIHKALDEARQLLQR